jgi:hypothetical protein
MTEIKTIQTTTGKIEIPAGRMLRKGDLSAIAKGVLGASLTPAMLSILVDDLKNAEVGYLFPVDGVFFSSDAAQGVADFIEANRADFISHNTSTLSGLSTAVLASHGLNGDPAVCVHARAGSPAQSHWCYQIRLHSAVWNMVADSTDRDLRARINDVITSALLEVLND